MGGFPSSSKKEKYKQEKAKTEDKVEVSEDKPKGDSKKTKAKKTKVKKWEGQIHTNADKVSSNYKLLDTIALEAGRSMSALPTTAGPGTSRRVIKPLSSRGPGHPIKEFPEFAIMTKLDHPNIIYLSGVFQDNHGVYLDMPYASGGDLLAFMKSTQKTFSELAAASLMKQMLSAVDHLHARSFCHRDLKLEHWVFDEALPGVNLLETPEKGELKLTSIGRVKFVMDGAQGTLESPRPFQGPVASSAACYMAPEVVQGKYTLKTDMWSLGVSAFFMLTGHFPFSTQQVLQQEDPYNFEKKDPWDRLSTNAKSFIEALLAKEEDRATAEQALDHEWVKSGGEGGAGPVGLPEGTKRDLALRDFMKVAMRKLVWEMDDDEVDAVHKGISPCEPITPNKLMEMFGEEGLKELLDGVDADANMDAMELMTSLGEKMQTRDLVKQDLAWLMFAWLAEEHDDRKIWKIDLKKIAGLMKDTSIKSSFGKTKLKTMIKNAVDKILELAEKDERHEFTWDELRELIGANTDN